MRLTRCSRIRYACCIPYLIVGGLNAVGEEFGGWPWETAATLCRADDVTEDAKLHVHASTASNAVDDRDLEIAL